MSVKEVQSNNVKVHLSSPFQAPIGWGMALSASWHFQPHVNLARLHVIPYDQAMSLHDSIHSPLLVQKVGYQRQVLISILCTS